MPLTCGPRTRAPRISRIAFGVGFLPRVMGAAFNGAKRKQAISTTPLPIGTSGFPYSCLPRWHPPSPRHRLPAEAKVSRLVFALWHAWHRHCPASTSYLLRPSRQTSVPCTTGLTWSACASRLLEHNLWQCWHCQASRVRTLTLHAWCRREQYPRAAALGRSSDCQDDRRRGGLWVGGLVGTLALEANDVHCAGRVGRAAHDANVRHSEQSVGQGVDATIGGTRG